MKKRVLFVAHSHDGRIIGNNGKMPGWKLKPDMDFFAEETRKLGTLYMGRKTFDSLPKSIKLFPGRSGVILTGNPLWTPENYEDQDNIKVVTSFWVGLEEAEKTPGDGIAIIGGSEIYSIALKNITFDEVHITKVFGEFKGDTFFPKLPFLFDSMYTCFSQKSFPKQEGVSSHPFDMLSYRRVA